MSTEKLQNIIINKAKELSSYIIEKRRHLHMNPETAFEEYETQAFIEREKELEGRLKELESVKSTIGDREASLNEREAMLLEKGACVFMGQPNEAVERYYQITAPAKPKTVQQQVDGLLLDVRL